MRTTIDIPAEIYLPALAKARRHGVSLSELIAAALRAGILPRLPEKTAAPPRPVAADPDFAELRAELGL